MERWGQLILLTIALSGMCWGQSELTARWVTIQPPGGASALALSADRHLLAVGDGKGTVRVYALPGGQQIAVLLATPTGSKAQGGAISALAFSSDGRWLGVGQNGGKVGVWDLNMRRQIIAVLAHSGAVEALAFSPDAHYLLSLSKEDRLLRVLNLPTGQIRTSFPLTDIHDGFIQFSRDGNLLAIGSWDELSVLKFPEMTTLASFVVGSKHTNVGGASFNATAEYVTAFDAVTGDVKIWSVKTREQVTEFIAPEWELDSLRALSFCGSAQTLYLFRTDGTIYKLDDLQSRPIRVVKLRQPSDPSAMSLQAVSSDCRALAFRAQSGAVHAALLDPATPAPQAAGPVAATRPTSLPACDSANAEAVSLVGGAIALQAWTRNLGGRKELVIAGPGPHITKDPDAVRRIATAVWVKEYVAGSSEVRSAQQRVALLLETLQEIQQYEAYQDITARAAVEAVAAVVTGGASLANSVPNLSIALVKHAFLNPRVLLGIAARRGLEESLKAYEELDNILPSMGSTPLELANVERIRQLYFKARGLELVYGSLGAALLPKHHTDLLDQAWKSLTSGVLSLVTKMPTTPTGIATLKSLYDLQEEAAQLASSIPGLEQFSASFRLAKELAASADRTIAAWTSRPVWCSQALRARLDWDKDWEARFVGWVSVGPDEKSTPIEMLVQKQGTRLSGFVGYSFQNAREWYPATGTVTPQGLFDFDEGRWGNRFRGQYEEQSGRIVGRGPSFALELAEKLEPNAVARSQPAPYTDAEWVAFYSRLRTAITRRDSSSLLSAMNVDFQYGNDRVNPTKALEMMLQDNDQWNQITTVLNSGETRPNFFWYEGRPTRVAVDRKPCPACEYEVALVFQHFGQGGWKWVALNFPGD